MTISYLLLGVKNGREEQERQNAALVNPAYCPTEKNQKSTLE